IVEAEAKLARDKTHAKKIMLIKKGEIEFKKRFSDLSKTLIKQLKPAENVQKEFMLEYIYGMDMFKKVLDRELQHIQDRMDLQIDGNLVRKAFDAALRNEERLHA